MTPFDRANATRGLRRTSHVRTSDRGAAFNRPEPEKPLPEREYMPPKLPLCPLLAGMKPAT